jgi:valyl-tRNA synthetase
MTLHFRKEVPFKQVYIHGLVRDAEGQKMSKSKGNVLDPIDLIDGIELEDLVTKRSSGMMQPKLAKKVEKSTRKQFPDGIAAYGTDALRFTYYSLASTGRDITFDIGRIEGYRNFCNKIWNAARYVLMNTEEHDCGQDGSSDHEMSQADRWIISRLQQTEDEVVAAMKIYRFDLASQAIYEFIWNEYCDWYLELSKPVLWDDNAPEALKKGTRRTLIRVLETTLRLLHPFMPYITEEIWQRVAPLTAKEGDSIMLQPYPVSNPDYLDPQAQSDIEWVKGVIIGLRNIRGEINIPPGKAIPVLLKNGTEEDQRRLQENRQFLMTLAKLEDITWLADQQETPLSATALVDQMEILVPMANLIDKEAEIARLGKEIDKLAKEVNRLSGKLNNANFVDKAPAEVVAKEQEKLAVQQQAQTKLEEQLATIKAM